MYTVTVRDAIMIAHSLNHPDFGPARNMHGATYTVDVSFMGSQLNEMNIVIDIALAHTVLKKVLSKLNYQNLDEIPEFKGKLTTTEFLAKFIHDEVQSALSEQFTGGIKVTLGESHVAWASYES